MRAPSNPVTILVALAAAWILSPAGAAVAQSPPAATGPLAPAVTVVRAEEREIVERAVVTGTLVPREEVLVAPEIEGLRITEVLVEEGAVVKQGQVLARLSRDIIETQLAQNTASLARADAAIAQAKSQIVQSEAALNGRIHLTGAPADEPKGH
jgi:multidrug efflux pump subunit AcrA (membrane-fusion protein)